MKNVKEQNFERELPAGYRQAKYINAKSLWFGIVFNLIALAILALVMFCVGFLLTIGGRMTATSFRLEGLQMITVYLIFFALIFGYMVLHELVHGIAYKRETGEKLAFGISWSCAFCGVPHIYTYRKTALVAVVSPFVLFTLIFIPILALLYFVSPLYFLVVAAVFGLHVGGCSGDLYVMCLLTFKYKHPKTLMRDTGPEQYFYVPDEACTVIEE